MTRSIASHPPSSVLLDLDPVPPFQLGIPYEWCAKNCQRQQGDGDRHRQLQPVGFGHWCQGSTGITVAGTPGSAHPPNEGDLSLETLPLAQAEIVPSI